MIRHILSLALVAVLFPMLSGCAPLAMDVGIDQERLDSPTPLLTDECQVGQTFRSEKPGLASIEVLLVAYGDSDTLADPAEVSLHLRADPGSTQDLAASTLTLAGKEHNDPLRFAFALQPDSADRSYYFCIRAPEESRIAPWQSTLDAYSPGAEFLSGIPQEGDLRFKTLHEYHLAQAISDILSSLFRMALPLTSALLLLFLPGYALLRLIQSRPVAWNLDSLAAALALSISTMPILLLWASLFGIRITEPWVLVLIAAGAIAAVGDAWRHLSHWRRVLREKRLQPSPYGISLLIICALTLGVRYVQIRDLALPPWVDSVHQTLITRLIADGGLLPTSYRPFAQVDGFYRHYGFHALAAFYAWLSNLQPAQAVLAMGQILNALAILPSYALAHRLTRRRLAGLIAAAITGLISIMPAYYASWGRYTQLAGMIILPLTMVMYLDGLGHSRRRPRDIVLAGLTTSGLLLTHYRATFFFALFAVVCLLFALATARGHRRFSEVLLRTVLIVACGGILALPWLVNVSRNVAMPLDALPVRAEAGDDYNAVPWTLLNTGHGATLTNLALAAIAWAILRVLVGALLRRVEPRTTNQEVNEPSSPLSLMSIERAWISQRPALQMAAWMAMVFLAINLHLFGLPDIGIVNNASAIIAAYLPISLLVGHMLSDIIALASARLDRLVASVVSWTACFTIVAIGVVGTKDMVTIINPSTVLATQDDVVAMSWIRENVPEGARFLINARPWQRGIYMGADGGWWIPILTDRQVTLPAVVYWGGTPSYVGSITAMAEWASTVPDLRTPEAVARLELEGVTHIYVGARTGNIKPEMMVGDPHFLRVYSSGTVWIFAFDADASADAELWSGAAIDNHDESHIISAIRTRP